MNWFNNLFTLMTTATGDFSETDSQLIWIVLGGLFLIILFAVVVSVVSTASAAAAVVSDDESEDM